MSFLANHRMTIKKQPPETVKYSRRFFIVDNFSVIYLCQFRLPMEALALVRHYAAIGISVDQ